MQKIIAILLLLGTAKLSFGQVFINELMARNNETIADEMGEFDDWIEIYNPTNQDVDLAGGYFSDDVANLTLHQIESGDPALTTVPANGYLIFWADGTPEQGANHLGMSLSAGGESVVLTLPNGEIIIDVVQFIDQENDISYGRVSDGAPDFQYFSIPTPDETNQDIIPDAASLFINEILTDNTNIIFDETGEYEDWIEIYNPNMSQVNLAGYSLNYNDGEAIYTIANTDPNATVIESENFKLFWCDNQSVEGIRHTNFELANTGNIKLIGPDGVTVVDELDYSGQSTNVSYGLEQDGLQPMVNFSIPTPNVTNQLEIVFPETLFINEIMASNLSDTTDSFGEFEDWIEIYNPNDFAVDLSGYHLSDNLGGNSWQVPSTFPDSVTVPPQGFLIFWADNDEEQGVRHTDFKLTTAGEDVVLLSPDNFTVADYENFPVQSEDVSWGRVEDGSEMWQYFTPEETTPEYSNHGAISVFEITQTVKPGYPNPTKDWVYLDKKYNQLQVFDPMGKLVQTKFNSQLVDLTDFESGVYLLVVDGVASQTLIKE